MILNLMAKNIINYNWLELVKLSVQIMPTLILTGVARGVSVSAALKKTTRNTSLCVAR